MFISNQRIGESILEMLDRHLQRSDLPPDIAFDLTTAATIMRHSHHVSVSDGADMRGYGEKAFALLRDMKTLSDREAGDATKTSGIFDDMITAAKRIAASSERGDAAKIEFTSFIQSIDRQLAQLVTAAPEQATSLLASTAGQWLTLHNCIDLFGTVKARTQAEATELEALSEANLSAYFREVLDDSTASVSGITTLPGGFGKETTLFSLSSRKLSTELVMRRDNPINPYGDLDCHVGPREFPVLKAVHARGFPAPEPLFFSQHSPQIKGPPFIIMRRAPGKVSGDAMGSSAQVPRNLQRTLAEISARLHAVPPLTELSGIPAFDPAMWSSPAGDCARNNILAHYRYYCANSHLPVPALHGLYSWLLTHLPQGSARPALIHGDIGFHNLLFSGDELSAVLDWEFAHIGDPAEDLGYIRSVMGKQLDWPQFIADYAAAGGQVPDERRIQFFEIWSHVRNATCTVLISDHMEAGRLRDIKLGLTVYRYLPHFINQAAVLIARHENS